MRRDGQAVSIGAVHSFKRRLAAVVLGGGVTLSVAGCNSEPEPPTGAAPTSPTERVDVGRTANFDEQSIPELLDAIGSDDLELMVEADEALQRRGAAAVPELVSQLASPDVKRRVAAGHGLRQLKEEGAAGLAEAVRTGNEAAQKSAVEMLGRMGRNAVPAMPVLIETLKHEDAHLRGASAYALGNVGKAATPAIPNLLAMLNDPVEWNRVLAIRAIGKIGLTPETTQPLEQLRSKDHDKFVQQALGEVLQPPGGPAAAQPGPPGEEKK